MIDEVLARVDHLRHVLERVDGLAAHVVAARDPVEADHPRTG